MPSFTASSSMHGRQRKLTKRVEQLLTSGGVESEELASRPPLFRDSIGLTRKRKRRRSQEGDESQSHADEVYDYEQSENEEDEDDKIYCICKQKSHGNMVACDNKQCKYEWFHWNCVAVFKAPVGKWYCPVCTAQMNSTRSHSVDRRELSES